MQFDDRFLKCSDCGKSSFSLPGNRFFSTTNSSRTTPSAASSARRSVPGLGRAASAGGADSVAVFAHRDTHGVLGMRHGDDGAVQADAGTASAVPVMLPDEARAYGRSCRGDDGFAGAQVAAAAAALDWSDDAEDGAAAAAGSRRRRWR